MERTDFVRAKLTEWGLSEFIQRFEDEGIDKEAFLSLGDSGDIKALISKIGPRVKFRKRLKDYLQMERCNFVQDKLAEWDLSELIESFEEEGIDKETFLSLEESGINDLIPKTGPRITFKKRLGECLHVLKIRNNDTPEMMDTSSEQEDSPEMDPAVFPWYLESTTASDTDSGNEMSEEPIYPGATVTRGQGRLAVILYILHHYLTKAMQCSLMALLNFLIPDLAVESKYLPVKNPFISTVFYCQKCQKYLGKSPAASCCHCATAFDKVRSFRNGSFFLSASLKDLLRDNLKTSTQLLPKTLKHEHDIKDVMDGRMYQTWLEQGELAKDDLTLSWNCDGVPIFESPTYSIWPLQFTINELPYTQRVENVIVAGLWFGLKKPEMNTFLKPFLDECQDLAQNPFQWRDSCGTVHSSKVFSLVCSSDAMARPLLRNCKQFNGEYGCDWCLHPGKMVKKGKGHMRSYPCDEMKQAPRSNKMFEQNARQAENTKNPKNGVRGSSLLSMLPLFDIVFGFVPEYMHSVLVGVSKQLVSLWLDTNNSTKAWYVGEQISEMDSRLLRLKPPSEISRRPRSLKCLDNWKASEWRAFLLFYAISVLPGILHPPFLEHYLCLSFSIHILLQESITQHDLQRAHQNLVRFVVDMKELYGEENVSFNCHQLIHLTESVQNWGPLWATSAFSFERNNGYLRALLKGKRYSPQLIYQSFVVWHHIPRHLDSLVFNQHSDFGDLLAKLTPGNDGSGSQNSLGNPQHLDLTGSIKLAVEELLNPPVPINSVEAFDSFTHRNTVYHSNSKESDQRDCAVKLTNGCCGEIQLMFVFQQTCVCRCQPRPIIVVRLYDITPDTLFSKTSCDNPSEIFMRVEKTDKCKAFFLADIRCKCMYVDGWLVPLPNPYERY